MDVLFIFIPKTLKNKFLTKAFINENNINKRIDSSNKFNIVQKIKKLKKLIVIYIANIIIAILAFI